MPSAQVINLNPQQRTTQTPLEQTLGAFATRFNENRQDQQDTDALRDIYGQYQQDGMNIQDTIKKIQTTPGISPTTRVNSVNQLMKMEEYNQKRTAVAEKQYRVAEHQKMKEEERFREQELEETKKAERRKALQESKATPQQIALYEASPVGGQTKIIEDIIEDSKRKRAPIAGAPDGTPDYDLGLTPSERVKRQDSRYALQTPLVNKNSESLGALESENMSLNLLDELTDSGKVGQGAQKLNINPMTGDLIIPQLGTPEEQLFAKTVNDFTVKAKDSFGARVTNFELDRFMQRLPTLANSPEGRKLIIRQMKIVNELNQMDKKAIQQVFDQYGVRNIDYPDAENKARESIKEKKEALRKEFFNLEQVAKQEEAEVVKKAKSRAKEGYTVMRKPDGTIKQFPTKNVPNLEEKGYQKL